MFWLSPGVFRHYPRPLSAFELVGRKNGQKVPPPPKDGKFENENVLNLQSSFNPMFFDYNIHSGDSASSTQSCNLDYYNISPNFVET